MSTATRSEPRIESVTVTDEAIMGHLADGRTISVPLAWSWRLSDATTSQRARWEIIADGHGIHWPDIDEDISLDGMLRGVPARRPRSFCVRQGKNKAGRVVTAELLRIVNRGDYLCYFKQAAMLPPDPATYRP